MPFIFDSAVGLLKVKDYLPQTPSSPVLKKKKKREAAFLVSVKPCLLMNSADDQ